jgi:hypothetical protein
MISSFCPVLSIQQLTLCMFVCCIDDSFIHSFLLLILYSTGAFRNQQRPGILKTLGLLYACIEASKAQSEFLVVSLIFLILNSPAQNVFPTSSREHPKYRTNNIREELENPTLTSMIKTSNLVFHHSRTTDEIRTNGPQRKTVQSILTRPTSAPTRLIRDSE